MKYTTIVVDPPWDHSDGTGYYFGDDHKYQRGSRGPQRKSATPYGVMSVEGIAALPVRAAAADDAHLFLWTTRRYLPHSFAIAEGWDFRYSALLTWCKPPMGFMGGLFTTASEFVVYARRGSPEAAGRVERDWWEWPRRGGHSVKPDALTDIIESVCPEPRLEMFARRARLAGWDYWGDEALQTVELPT